MTDDSELKVHNFGWGLSGAGRPAISFTVTLPNGLEGTFGWEEDAEDVQWRERILDHYEPKIKELLAGNQGFMPTAQSIGFEADKKG